MKFRILCISFAVVFLLGVCGQVAAQQTGGGQNAATRAPGSHEVMSADEVAKELSNPAGSLASIFTYLEYTSYEGDLPDADDQDSWSLDLQPVLPFPVGDKGNSIIFRPFIPLDLSSPIFDANTGGFDNSDVNLGDISAQLVYSGKKMTDKHSGYPWAVGFNFTTPSATDEDLGGHSWNLGPTVFGAILRKWGLVGLVVQHEWDVAGWNEEAVNVTNGQYFIAISLGKGWQFATSPNFAYDHQAEAGQRWTFPVGAGLSKTTKIGKMPVKFQFENQYFIEKPDAFGPDWLFKFSVTPVIQNPFLAFFN